MKSLRQIKKDYPKAERVVYEYNIHLNLHTVEYYYGPDDSDYLDFMDEFEVLEEHFFNQTLVNVAFIERSSHKLKSV